MQPHLVHHPFLMHHGRMSSRHKRRLELSDLEKEVLLEALRVCRKAVIVSQAILDPYNSSTYAVGGRLLTAIDDLIEDLTGDRKLFHARSSTR